MAWKGGPQFCIGLTDGSRALIFVAALEASSYTYACATPHESMKDWLESTARALGFIGGVPQLIVPDNAKAMIADANRYEPRSNDTVLDFARQHGTSILLSRPRHPQDKAKAESAVQLVERWIMARLRHQKFDSVNQGLSSEPPVDSFASSDAQQGANCGAVCNKGNLIPYMKLYFINTT